MLIKNEVVELDEEASPAARRCATRNSLAEAIASASSAAAGSGIVAKIRREAFPSGSAPPAPSRLRGRAPAARRALDAPRRYGCLARVLAGICAARTGM